MQIIIGDNTIDADGYIPRPEENTIQFFKKKSDLDYIPPIKIGFDFVSDFGRELLLND